MGLTHVSQNPAETPLVDLPYHTLVLLLSDVLRDLAVDLAGAQSHSQSFSHIILYGRRNSLVLVCRANPYVCSSDVLKFACSKLCDLRS